MNDKLEAITKDLFSRDAIDVMNDNSPSGDELYDSLIGKARAAIEEFSWLQVFES